MGISGLGVSSVVEYFSIMYKALGSIINTTGKRGRGEREPGKKKRAYSVQ